MPDENPSGPAKTTYSSNSRVVKSGDNEPERPRVRQVVPPGQAVERKKSMGSKFREQFAGDNARNVGEHLLLEVIVPQTKNLIFELGREFLQRILFGSNRPISSVVGSVIGNRTSYTSYSKNPQGGAPSSMLPAAMTPQQRSMHDFSGTILPEREMGLQVIDVLSTLIADYGAATVNDFYDCIGQTPDFAAVKYGWKNLSQATVRHIGRDGYLLEMPKPMLLE